MYFHYFAFPSPWKRNDTILQVHPADSIAVPSPARTPEGIEHIWIHIPFTFDFFVPSLDDIGLVVLQKTILKHWCCTFTITFLYWKGVTLHSRKKFPSPKNAFRQILLKMYKLSGKEILNVDNAFLLFLFYLPLEKEGVHHLINLKIAYQKITTSCAKILVRSLHKPLRGTMVKTFDITGMLLFDINFEFNYPLYIPNIYLPVMKIP